MWKTQYGEAKAGRKLQGEAGEIWNSVASFLFDIVTVIILAFFLSAIVIVYEAPEYFPSMEENVEVFSSTTTFSVKGREAVTMDLEMFVVFTLTNLTKMLLIMAGIEMNPGPTTIKI